MSAELSSSAYAHSYYNCKPSTRKDCDVGSFDIAYSDGSSAAAGYLVYEDVTIAGKTANMGVEVAKTVGVSSSARAFSHA